MKTGPNKIEVKELSIFFGDIVALKSVSFSVVEHQVLSIIGPANSGKSSLLLAMNRMIERLPEARVEGQIFLDGREIASFDDVEALRRRVGMVYAFPIPLPMTIRENVLFGLKLTRKVKKGEADQVVEESLRAAFLFDEVKDRLDSSALNLSGGQQQRLCMARTLAVGPEVIMLDEPCSGLDPISTAQVENAMKELKKTCTVILVTNNTKQAARVGDRTAFFLMGDLVEINSTDKMFTAPEDKRTEEYVTGKFG